ncbi:uncharacterized protein LOC128870098 [Anastrepha ludens]|uniref:uncharacterized protein LOC128870098 n=1 Tax=Anastrepha ludens TaxID=28586 RepID=UPI0023AEF797|nr:uncharacterized protein LOC128870098 [Anastrepha ludens]
MPDIPNIGAESEIVITNDPVTPSVESTDESVNSPRPSRRRKTDSDELIKKMIKSMNERNEEERKFRERSLNCMEQFCDSMNNVANAILALSQAVVNKDYNNK